ncbi:MULTISPECIES: signal peptidase I [Streptomyces]|uniref:signal peptidase I n=1 Tax=Streptomyces TaxID=1883 RepID=UPI000A3D374F|nr:signal peptidase I [Streptomyces viridochromogenes]
MGGESTIRTAPRAGASKGPAGSRTGQVLSGLAVALGLLLFLGGFAWGAVVYRPYTVPTSSMAPTINAGARVLAQRVDGGDVHRGDVVVFTDKTWVSNAPVVKRVVAVGGDTVACCTDGRLTVNGKQIEEPYLADDGLAELQGFPSVKVPEGRIFLLGDERSGSLDSTAHLTDAARGTVARSAVSARVEAVVWPMDGMLEQATGFEKLGALSPQGPLRTQGLMILAGAVLVLGGGAYGPIAKLLGGRSRKPEPARVG